MMKYRDLCCELPENRLGRNLYLASGAFASVALILLLSAGFGTRLGLWHFRTGFTLLRYAAWIGSVAALASGAGLLLSIGVSRRNSLFFALAIFCVALTTVVIPLYWKMVANRAPRIHDITTDTVNPPSLVAILPLRKDAANPPEYGGKEIAAMQHDAYPDIKPLVMNLPLDQAYTKALDIAKKMKWQVVANVQGDGRIEATDTTLWFGFKDDIVIRITPVGVRSVLDIRSVSRVGLSDVGTNASRIRAFLENISK